MTLKELKVLVENDGRFSIPTAKEERKWIESGNISELVNHSYHNIVFLLENNEYDKYREEDIISDLIILLYEYAPNYNIDNIVNYKTYIKGKIIRNYNLVEVENEQLSSIGNMEADDCFEIIYQNMMKEEVIKLIDKYSSTERAKEVIILYYYYNYTYEEIAKYYHRTRERIRQILAKQIRIYRHPSSHIKYLGYYLPEWHDSLDDKKERERLEKVKARENLTANRINYIKHPEVRLAELEAEKHKNDISVKNMVNYYYSNFAAAQRIAEKEKAIDDLIEYAKRYYVEYPLIMQSDIDEANDYRYIEANITLAAMEYFSKVYTVMLYPVTNKRTIQKVYQHISQYIYTKDNWCIPVKNHFKWIIDNVTRRLIDKLDREENK